MSKLNKTLLLTAGVIIVGSLALLGGKSFFSKKEGSTYSAIYMTSGDIYFGKLERSPQLTIANVYTLQKNQDAQTPFTLVKFKDAFWGPKDELVLSEGNVVWITDLDENSPVLKNILSKEGSQ